MLAFTLAGIASTAAQTFTLTLQPNTIPAVTQGVAYNQAITAVGGNANYSLVVTSGSLPSGITLTGGAGSWALTGTSNSPGSYSFTITATDIDGNTGFRPYTFSIGTSGGLTLSPASLPNGSQGVAYNQTVTASGGSGGYVYSISAGSLPNGLSLSSGGVISGTPSTGGSFSFTVFVRDSDGNTGTRAYTVNIGSNILTVLPSTLPNGTQGVALQPDRHRQRRHRALHVLGDGRVAADRIVARPSAGNLTGTPTGSGSSTFTVRAIDSVNNTGTRSYTINIGSNILTVSPADAAERHARHRLQPDHHRERRQRAVHVRGDGRHAADRPVAQQRRRAQRHAERERLVHLHGAGDRHGLQHRLAQLHGHHQPRRADDQPVEPAGRDGQHRL